jgi:hypothetical protein
MDRPNESIAGECSACSREGQRHVTLTCADLTPEMPFQHVPGVALHHWHLFEHVRIAQWDIVEFCFEQEHKSPEWLKLAAPSRCLTDEQWQESAGPDSTSDGFCTCCTRLAHRPAGPACRTAPDQTIMRETFLIADHYHTGKLYCCASCCWFSAYPSRSIPRRRGI